MASHSSILAWEIPYTEEPSGLKSVGLQESDTTWRLNHHRSFWVCFSHASTSALLLGSQCLHISESKVRCSSSLALIFQQRWHTWLLFWHGWGLRFCDQGLPWYASAFQTVSSQPLFLLFLPLKIEPFLGLNLGFTLLVHDIYLPWLSVVPLCKWFPPYLSSLMLWDSDS